MEDYSKTPRLAASTGSTYCCSITDSRIRERERQRNHDATSDERTDSVLSPSEESTREETSRCGFEDDMEVNYFKSVQWQAPSTPPQSSSL